MDFGVPLVEEGEGNVSGWLPKKESGAESRPTRKAREKLRVERAARNMPRRRREMHCARRRCGAESRAERDIREARMVGRRMLERVKPRRMGWRVYFGAKELVVST